jgi:hypothetical protein
MVTTAPDLAKVITERWVEFIQKSLEATYDYEVKKKVQAFENELIKKRDEVVSWAVLHIMKMMDLDRREDRIIITIRTKETP